LRDEVKAEIEHVDARKRGSVNYENPGNSLDRNERSSRQKRNGKNNISGIADVGGEMEKSFRR